ncbi:uncharacterized protein ACJ7VT_011782 [Polymixia lowei]
MPMKMSNWRDDEIRELLSSISRKRMWTFAVVVAGCGVTVGVILLGLVPTCTQRRNEKCVSKRPKAKYDDNLTNDCMPMGGIYSRGESPAGNVGPYSLISSVPVNAFPTDSAGVDKQEHHNGNSDTYHIYSSIPEEPAASTKKDMVYSTLQAY